ncbi:cytochrome P450 [archaeon]|nr:MAG: cytochrome P450 [archaeon]
MMPPLSESTYLFLVILVFSLICLVLALGVYFLLDARVFDDLGHRLPGPSNHLWGSRLMSLVTILRGVHPYACMLCDQLMRKLGDNNIIAFNTILGQQYVIVSHPEMVKNILTGHYLKYKKNKTWDRLAFLLGDGLLTCDDREYTRFKSILTPLCRSQALKCMVTVFNIHTRRLLRHWSFRWKKAQLEAKSNEGIRVLMDDDIRNLITGIMCEAGFGYDFFTKGKNDTVAEDFETIVSEIVISMQDPFSWSVYLSPQRNKQVRKAIKRLQDTIDKCIEDRIAKNEGQYEKASMPDSQLLEGEESDAAPESNDFVHLMIQLNDSANDYHRLSKKQMRDHILTFMVSGYENIVYTLLWMLFELALHPAIQKKCQDEIDAIMLLNNVPLSAVVYEDIPKFNMLIQVVKETMRLHPVQPMLSRTLAVKCDVGGYQINPNTHLLVSLMKLHRHPEFWYLPDDFLPDRFSEDNITETIKHPFQYLPFGAGSRSCIGQRFGQMALTVVAALLLSKFSFSMTSTDKKDMAVDDDYMHVPVNMRLVVRPRENLETY